MARKDYISDNLINMQSKLKEVYATKSPGASAAAPAAATNAPAAAANTVTPGQLKHDLATRLERELSAVAADFTRQKTRLEDLDSYKAFLEETISGIDQLDESGAEFRRNLDNMRMEFFRQAGRINAAADAGPKDAGAALLSDKHCFIIAGTILGGAVIVAVTLIALFA